MIAILSEGSRKKVAKRRGPWAALAIGALYRRTRPDGEGGRRMRAEARFDGLAGCLRTPGGGSSRQFLLWIEGRETRSRLSVGARGRAADGAARRLPASPALQRRLSSRSATASPRRWCAFSARIFCGRCWRRRTACRSRRRNERQAAGKPRSDDAKCARRSAPRSCAPSSRATRGPSLCCATMLRSIKPGYRLHRADLPGKPDIVYGPRRLAIFMHGCFWHGHDCKRGARAAEGKRRLLERQDRPQSRARRRQSGKRWRRWVGARWSSSNAR